MNDLGWIKELTAVTALGAVCILLTLYLIKRHRAAKPRETFGTELSLLQSDFRRLEERMDRTEQDVVVVASDLKIHMERTQNLIEQFIRVQTQLTYVIDQQSISGAEQQAIKSRMIDVDDKLGKLVDILVHRMRTGGT